MGRILITGASGFIGRALAQALAENHDIVCMSRRDPGLGLEYVRGEFQSFEDLRQLDPYALDAVVHLAAVTDSRSERDAMLVNVEGTRCLMRYLIDRGCRKFVMASSIAAMGIESVACRPLRVPVPDEHPCLDRNGYGFSKYLMEEVTRYCHRQNPDLDAICLRLSAVCPDETPSPLVSAGALREWALGGLAVMCLTDAVRAFVLAVEAPHEPGVRVLNACGPKAWAKDPVAKILRAWYGTALDVSHYEQAGHEWDSVYDVTRIKRELHFVAQRVPGQVFGSECPGR